MRTHAGLPRGNLGAAVVAEGSPWVGTAGPAGVDVAMSARERNTLVEYGTRLF